MNNTASVSDDQHAAADAAARRRKEIYIMLGSLALACVLLVAVYAYWNYDREHPVTDDAFLQANYVWIKPQVSGRVTEVHVRPNQSVTAGELLFRIDPAPFQQHLSKAEQQLLLVKQLNVADKATVAAINAQIKEQQAVIETARQFSDSYKKMEKEGAASRLGAISYADVLISAKSKLLELQANLARATAELGDETIQQARITAVEVDVELARLDLQWSEITAPADGSVTAFTIRVGDVLEAGQLLFPFIETKEWWVQANFKETDVAEIRPDMPATISIDSYGGRKFNGVVDSISSGTAASFSLLPAQNTTGNWVKVTQRIPVRIRMPAADPDFPYRFGASVVAVVDIMAPAVKDAPASVGSDSH